MVFNCWDWKIPVGMMVCFCCGKGPGPLSQLELSYVSDGIKSQMSWCKIWFCLFSGMFACFECLRFTVPRCSWCSYESQLDTAQDSTVFYCASCSETTKIRLFWCVFSLGERNSSIQSLKHIILTWVDLTLTPSPPFSGRWKIPMGLSPWICGS